MRSLLIALLFSVSLASPVWADEDDRPALTARGTRYEDVERWRPIVAQWDDWDHDLALKVIDCEASGQNVPNRQGSGAKGIFQLLGWEWLARKLYGPDASVWDPEVNIGVAHFLWKDSGGRFSFHWLASMGCWG